MSDTTQFTATISSTAFDAKLGIEIWLDDTLIKDIESVTETITFNHNIVDESDSDHVLKFVLKNKLPEHTKVDENGNIVSDALITINDIKFEDIDVDKLFSKLSVYQHDYNGTGQSIQDKFFGAMGCNGTVTFEFSTPFYLWLLENM